MEDSFAQTYRHLYDHHWWFRARASLLVSTLERHRPAEGYGRILDVGSGDGLFLERLAEFGSPEGLEPVAEVVSECTRQRWPMHLCQFDETFEPGNRYGLIGMFDVLEHLDDDVGALEQARRLLEPRGLLSVTVPAFELLWTSHDDTNHHRRRYSRRQLAAAIEAAGLELVEQRYFFQWLVPLKLAVRLRERLLGPSPPMSLPAPALNRLFLELSHLEQGTWGRLPLPFGSSLLAVARRSGHGAG